MCQTHTLEKLLASFSLISALLTTVAWRVSLRSVEWAQSISVTGFVASPGYPNNYPDWLEKTELIQVEQGMILYLEFTAFDLDFDPVLCDLNCNCDHLTITDGDGTTLMARGCGSSANSTAIFEGKLIGSSLPPAIVSKSNSISIAFRTGSLGSKSGWRITWKAVAPGATYIH